MSHPIAVASAPGFRAMPDAVAQALGADTVRRRPLSDPREIKRIVARHWRKTSCAV